MPTKKKSPSSASRKLRAPAAESSKRTVQQAGPAAIAPPASNTPFLVVGVGASAGGLEAFTELLQSLPGNTNIALVFVQHLDPRHDSLLTELLTRATPMRVIQAADGMRVEPDHVYVIPPDTCMVIAGGVLGLEQRASHRMTVDHFFRSLAADYGSRAVGVVLSGTASDGTLGLKAIKAEGGITFAQEEESAKYDGMPRSAILAGCVDFVLPPEAIAAELDRLCRHPYVDPERQAGERHKGSQEPLTQILSQLRTATGVDFAHYKHANIQRRVLRRMALLKVEHLSQYAEYLRRNPPEREALFADILINVTGFFREPATFDALHNKVFPAIFRSRRPQDALRIWVPGCATGEEVYSIAIVLLEYMRLNDLECPIQIFGTDLSETSLEKARAGLYPASIATEVSAERLRRFFVKINGSYQISRGIRDLCVFARQDLTRDAPFSRLDLISCRNVLIYFGPVLQSRAMRLFHYGLKPSGFLVLGQSESIGPATDLFAPMEGKEKIYTRKPRPAKSVLEIGTYEEAATPVSTNGGKPPAIDLLRQADQLILAQHSPPAVLVDEDLKVLQFRGRTSEFLEHTTGKPSLNLAKMTRGGIALEIRRLIQTARKTGNTVTGKPLATTSEDGSNAVRLSVTAIHGVSQRDMAYLVVFEHLLSPGAARGGKGSGSKGKVLTQSAAARRNQELEAELLTTKQYLQSVVQEQEAAVEELKSAHEEVQSSNEELQSTNEELLTSKEELQSSNEELNTVNEEMQSRNTELQQTNDDLNNLLSSTSIPTVMLGNDLRIRRVTAQAEKVLGLLPSDAGRKITDFRIKINCPDLEELFVEVIESLHGKDREVQDEDGRTWLMNIRPYRTLDNKIDGAVMTLYDVTERRQSAEIRYRRLFEKARDGIVICEAATGEILDINPFVVRLCGFPRVDLIGRKIWEAGPFAGSAINISTIAKLQTDDSLRIATFLQTLSHEQIPVDIVANAYQEGGLHVVQFNIRQVAPESTDEQNRGKLEAVGRLAGGLAHEFNNILTIILGYCDLMADRSGRDAVLREQIENVRRAGEGAVALTRRLLAFGRREKTQATVLDLSTVLAEMEQVLRVMLPDNIELVLRTPESVGNIRADRSQFEQTLASLVLNARDAMPEGGRLTIEASREKVDEAFCREHPSVAPGDYVTVQVSDTGAGMTLETLSHLFDPFFTTKPRGTGSGLALVTIDRFVKEAGGCILASSEFRRGTSFRIFLPHVDETAGVETKPQELVHGSGSILLVDDDPAVRRVTRSILERCGYQVTEAPGGPEALRAANEAERLDLLLTDVVMPRMSGRELADRILTERPQTRVLYMSAHTDEVLEPHGVLNGGSTVLRKPFAPAVLCQKISQVLQQKSDSKKPA